MKLYNLAGGSNPRRVRIYLAEKGIEVTLVDLDIMQHDNDTPEFLGKNPLGKLPVLELDDGTILTESMAIIRYFEELHPQPPLLGSTPLEKAQIEMWNRRMELEIAIPTAQAFQHTHKFWADRLQQVPEYGELCRTKVMERLHWLDHQLELSGREFIAAERYTMADISALCGLMLGKVIKIQVPAELVHLTRWYATVSARPSAQA
jgi:glutathione S-transferase